MVQTRVYAIFLTILIFNMTTKGMRLTNYEGENDITYKVVSEETSVNTNKMLYYFFNISNIASTYEAAMDSIYNILPKKLDFYGDIVATGSADIMASLYKCSVKPGDLNWQCMGINASLIYKLDVKSCKLETSKDVTNCFYKYYRASRPSCVNTVIPQCYGGWFSGFQVFIQGGRPCDIPGAVTVCKIKTQYSSSKIFSDPTALSILRNSFREKMDVIIPTENGIGQALLSIVCNPCAWAKYGGGMADIKKIKESIQGLQDEMKTLENNLVTAINGVQDQIQDLTNQVNRALSDLTDTMLISDNYIWTSIGYTDQLNQISFKLLKIETVFNKMANSIGIGAPGVEEYLNISRIEEDIISRSIPYERNKLINIVGKDGFYLTYPVNDNYTTYRLVNEPIECDTYNCYIHEDMMYNNGWIVINDVWVKHNLYDIKIGETIHISSMGFKNILGKKVLPNGCFVLEETKKHTLRLKCFDMNITLECNNKTEELRVDNLLIDTSSCQEITAIDNIEEGFVFERKYIQAKLMYKYNAADNLTFEKGDYFNITVSTLKPATVDFGPVDDLINQISGKNSRNSIWIYVITGVIILVLIIIAFMIYKFFINK